MPIGSGAQGALLHWRDYYRARFPERLQTRLFLSANGGELTVNALEEVVKRAGVATGVPRLTCHLLRHTFATNYLVRQVGDPLRLQQILGHTSLEMVRHYVAMANVQQSLLERRSSPMDLISAEGQPSSRGRGRQAMPSRSRQTATGRLTTHVEWRM